MVRSSTEYRAGGGVFWDVFAAVGLTPDVLAGLTREGSVYRTGGAVAVARLGGEGGEAWKQVCFLAGDPEQASKLVKHVHSKNERVKVGWSLVYAPQGSRLIGSLRGMGLKRSWSLVLFERRLPKD
jgi:hypothetical protein